MDGAFLTGLLRGIQRASQQKKAESQRAEELKLRERSAGLQERLAGIQEQRALQEASKSQLELGTATRQRSARDKIQEYFTTGELREPTLETDVGDQPIGSIPVPQEQVQGRLKGALSELTPAQDLSEMLGIGQKPQIVGPGAAVVSGSKEIYKNPNVAQGGLADQIVRQLATDAQGNFDPTRAMDIYQRMRTNPQGAESRIFDYLQRKNQTGQVNPAMEQTIKDYQSTVFGTAASRSGGAVVGATQQKATPLFQDTTRQTAESSKIGTGAGERKTPLGQKAITWIHPDSLAAAQPTMTMEEAESAGFRPFTQGQAPQFVSAARSVLSILDQWDNLVALLPKSTGDPYKDLAMTAAEGIKLQVKRRDPKVAQFLALKRSQLPLLARSMGDVANIAIAEQEFQAEAMPSEYDTQESARAKLSSRRALMRNYIRSALGVGVGGEGQQRPAQQQIQDPLGIRGR